MTNKTKLPLALALLGALAAPPVAALTGGTVDANTTSSPWAGVVSVTPAGGGIYSGALIDRSYVLTSAHVAAGFVNNPGNLKININYGGNLTQQISASQIFVHPDYFTGRTIGHGTTWNDDIALVRLSTPAAAGVPVYSIFAGSLSETSGGAPRLNGSPVDVTLVAYGGYADGTSADVQTASNAAVKRVGANRLESLYDADAESPGTPPPANVNEGYTFVFDAPGAANHLPGEAGYAGGDSGSPIFIDDQGEWRIVGVAAFNGGTEATPDSPLRYGAMGGGMLIAPYAGWIQAQMVPVPEPQAYMSMLAGLGLIVVACLRRRARHEAGGLGGA